MKLLPRRLILIGLIVLGFAAVIATPAASLGGATSRGQATAPLKDQPTNGALPDTLAAAQPGNLSTAYRGATTPPPPEQDPCLSCHIAGEFVNEWIPISRWYVFIAMWFIFIFGITRNVSVWKSRDLWQPRRMVHLGSIAASFFALQAVSGIILVFFYKSTPEAVISTVSVIKTIHWGSGIILFITTLGLSLTGYLLPGYQRAFWLIIGITTVLGSGLAIANLSFYYLYAEWHIPPSPSRLYAFHILLLPIIIAGAMSLYFIIPGKRGETK